ncbi:c-type cytochrome [Loktanella sp. S4079]|uniref:c-type cytochrome n=1 Tax=Loktanella sp. S4079 TaxID=579483 RepID=UPI00061FC5CC|nr:cytochrome c family protein [Loktanella sp. S4079]KJZ17546.1 hypothetical protein TW80_16910 [Loktanella sp. S4079]
MNTKSLIGIATVATLAMAGSLSAEDQVAEVAFEITGDAAAGERVFRRCAACHAVGDGAEAKAGPVLNGIVGRAAGIAEGFDYSPALLEFAAAQELIWVPETLDAFLTKPREYIDGTKMTYAGLRKEEDRANLIAYLATFEE